MGRYCRLVICGTNQHVSISCSGLPFVNSEGLRRTLCLTTPQFGSAGQISQVITAVSRLAKLAQVPSTLSPAAPPFQPAAETVAAAVVPQQEVPAAVTSTLLAETPDLGSPTGKCLVFSCVVPD